MSIRKIIKEEIDSLNWVNQVPDYFSNEVYEFLEKNTEIKDNKIENDFIDTPTEYKSIVYTYLEDGYKEAINVTFNNKKRVLNTLVNFVEYHLGDHIDERTLIKTVRTFLNDKVYV